MGRECKWPWGVCSLGGGAGGPEEVACGLHEGVSSSEEGACVVPGREALGCGWPWGDGAQQGEEQGETSQRGREASVPLES